MEDNTAENKIFSAGYAGTFAGATLETSDNFVIFFEKEPEGTVGASNVYVLTDGMNNTYHPQVASRFAGKKILYEYFKSHDFIDANKLALAIRNASNEIYEYAQTQDEKMATVVVAAAVTDGKAVIGSIGDSRAYVVRSGKVYQITEDQSVIEEKVRSGEMTREEAFKLESTGSLVRTIGSEKDIVVDIYDGVEVRPDDILLLCSSGLTAYVGKDEILAASQNASPKDMVENLLNVVKDQNNQAEASVIVIRIYDEETIQSVVRQPGTLPAETDLNRETKELDLIHKSKPKRVRSDEDRKKTAGKPVFLIGAAILALLAFALFWIFSGSQGRQGLFGPKFTATPTIDPVQATLAVLQQTAQAEEIIRLSWTPTMTFTPEPTATATLQPTDLPAGFILDETGAVVTTTPTITVPQGPPTPTPIDREPIVSEKDQAEMVYVKAGEFILGSDIEKDGLANMAEEGPQISVYLDGFWIDKYEVTNAKYLMCVNAGGCSASGYMVLNNPDYSDMPVTYVTVDGAAQYCQWAGKKLPNEIEWEKAARGTDGRIYPWGDDAPVDGTTYANYPGYSNPDTGNSGVFKVGSFENGVSPYGAYDMAGNVWEWTSSLYQADYYGELADSVPEGSTVVMNPSGSENGSANVIRGGSAADTEINNYQAYLRTANRSYVNMMSSYYIGFRCILPDTESISPTAIPVEDAGTSNQQ